MDDIISQNFIRQLDESTINKIAAGEVVERPASAVKELVENALDAKAKHIAIAVTDGGKTLIRVSDDGHGIHRDDLLLALARHATSKISDDDFNDIRSFGFRGEALAALGAVGHLKVLSRYKESGEGAQITMHGNQADIIRPAALNVGTVVELRNLFHATPARLKFLRTTRTEMQAIVAIIKRLAMMSPDVGFILNEIDKNGRVREILRYDAQEGSFFDILKTRLSHIMGVEFVENSVPVNVERESLQIKGFAALPTFSRAGAASQYIFVNARPVKDRLLYGALRVAYGDFISRDRYPVVALNIICAPSEVDVNVHPAKVEVRFRDTGLVRSFLISALRAVLAQASKHSATTLGDATLEKMRPLGKTFAQRPLSPSSYSARNPKARAVYNAQIMQAPVGFGEEKQMPFEHISARVDPIEDVKQDEQQMSYPLGVARAQFHENYIIAQTADGIVIVDQHAAHERLVYEKLKKQMAENGVERQLLLIPEIVELSQNGASLLEETQAELAKFGVIIENFGINTVIIREMPAILGKVDVKKLIDDIVAQLEDVGNSTKMENTLNAILSLISCHGSIRSGRRMNAEEMNALLRQMEETSYSGQCNHGRPTYVALKLSDIEKLFGRS